MKPTLVAIALSAALALPPITPAMAADTPALPAAGTYAQAQPARGYLGVTIGRLPEPVRAQLPDAVPSEQGLLVEQVMADSPAAKAGLQPFDILLQYNDQKLFSPEQFVQLVRTQHSGQPAKLTIVRGGKVATLDVTLGEVSQAAEANRLSRLEALPPRAAHRRLIRTPAQQAARQNKEGVWESFDSLSLDKVGDNQYQAKIGYLSEDGKHQHREFKGSRDEIRQQILAQKDLPTTERNQLLDALNPRSDDLPFGPWVMAPPAWWGWHPDF